MIRVYMHGYTGLERQDLGKDFLELWVHFMKMHCHGQSCKACCYRHLCRDLQRVTESYKP